jgi:AhpD family alkylhydroperoxidase
MPPAIQLVEPEQNEFLASLEARAKSANPFFRAMAHRPEVLKSFVPFYGAAVGPGSVERRIKTLVYLTCSYANKCAFCIQANLPGARKAGITEDEIQAVQAQHDHLFSEPERAAIAYARELTRTADAEASRGELLKHFTGEQVVEITLVVCLSNFTNRFNNGLQIFPES